MAKLLKYNIGFFMLARHVLFARQAENAGRAKPRERDPILPRRAHLAHLARRTVLARSRRPFRIGHFEAILLAVPPFRPLNRPLLSVLFGRRLPIVKFGFMSSQNPERLHC